VTNLARMDWNDVRYFLALARLGSVRSAGEALGVSHSTVARRVEALEARLAARLFDRNREGYQLTDAGRRMVERAERAEKEMLALERELVGCDEKLAGPVHITCCDAFVSDLLMPELARLCTACPGIELGMTTDARPFDLNKREADIALRVLALGNAPQPYLIGRRVAPVTIASYVAEAHRERLDPGFGGTPRWIAFDDKDTMSTVVADSGFPDAPMWGALGSIELMVQGAHAGLGICFLPTYVGDREAGLRRTSKSTVRHMADLWLLSHPDLRDNARFAAARDAVVRALEPHAALFAGQIRAS
jgi:DNA-binding transcriptional LysR family regulator